MNNSINSIYKQRSYRVHTQPILQSYLQACSAEQCLTIHAERKCYESSAATPYFMFLSGLKQLQGLPSRLCSARSASRFTTTYFDAVSPTSVNFLHLTFFPLFTTQKVTSRRLWYHYNLTRKWVDNLGENKKSDMKEKAIKKYMTH